MKKYFTHISALRGLAILMVVLYHLVPALCPHGYLGVDIFLMISGYLLVSGLMKNDGYDFKLCEFVNKKILRIFPPLLFMLVPALCFSLYALSESEMLLSFKTAFYSLLGSSNIFLDKNTQGYFAANGFYNPFLHTWYLSVILQAYIIFALIAWGTRSFSKKVKWGAYLICGLASILFVCYYCFLLPAINPHEFLCPLYYLTWGRLFEIVAGAFILLLPPVRKSGIRSILTVVATITIIYCCFSKMKLQEPVLLATGILLWAPAENMFGKLLDNPIFRFLGKYSFSLYLWHWPIIVYTCYIMEHCSIASYVFIFIACIIAGMLAYHIAEKCPWKLVCTITVWCITVFLSLLVLSIDNISQRLHPNVHSAFHIPLTSITKQTIHDYPESNFKIWGTPAGAIDKADGKGAAFFKLGKQDLPPSFMMMGDSHAFAFVHGLSEIANKLNVSGYFFPQYVTPFHDRMCGRSLFRFSEQQYTALFNWLKQHPEIHNVILIQRWSIRLSTTLNDASMPLRYDGTPVPRENLYEANEAALARFCSQLTDIGKQVIIMTEVPPIRKDPEPYVRRALLHKHTIDHSLISCTKDHYYDLFSRQLASFERLESAGICKVIHVEERFIQDGIFYAYKDNQCHMMDDDHISNLGAILYARQYFNDWAVLHKKKD